MTVTERLLDVRLEDIKGTNIVLHLRDSKHFSPIFFECASSLEALEFIFRLLDSHCYKDAVASERAGYSIYSGSYGLEPFTVSDLGNRWELNTRGGKSYNFWYA